MNLSIVYVNDVHGYLEPHPELFYKGGTEYIDTAGGYAAVAAIINNIRSVNKNTLVFDGGDTFHGTLPLIQSKGEAILPILNKIGFDGMVAHWDFAYGPEQLKKLAAQLTYPVLGINVYMQDGSLFLPPYIIKEMDGLKIAVIGICCNIIDKTMPKKFSEGLTITDGKKELPQYIKAVKSKGADIVILLSHNGFPQDVSLLSEISGIDVCLSAHTHNRLYEAVNINNTIVIQCGCHGSFVGNLTLDIMQSEIIDFKYELIAVDTSVSQDLEVEKMVQDIMEPFQFLKKEVLGTTTKILHRYNTLDSGMDALLLTALKNTTNTDIAFSNGWRYGTPIAPGLITKWDLYNIIPMNPEVSTVEMSGREIIEMLEENLERTFSADPMSQMGGYIKRCLGIHVKMRIENPNGYRIQQIFYNEEMLEHERIYKVSFVTMQGVPEKYGKNRITLSQKAIEIMELYLKERGSFETTTSNVFCLV